MFQYFGSKAGLFVECYLRASESLPSFLDAPPSVRARGFFSTVRYWIESSEHSLAERGVAYDVLLAGDYDTPMAVKRELTRIRRELDPAKAQRVVHEAIAAGELRDDVDPLLLASIVEWMLYRFQDVLMREELDPGIVVHAGDFGQRARAQIDQFMAVLESAVGHPSRQL